LLAKPGMSWIGWALLSACFAAATALLAKVGVAHVDSNLAMALRTTVVLLFAWGIVFVLAKPGVVRRLELEIRACSTADLNEAAVAADAFACS
jgi:uncharacterized membrane protein